MPRIFFDTGDDFKLDIHIQEGHDEKTMFVKIATSEGMLYAGELTETEKEFLSPPEEIL